MVLPDYACAIIHVGDDELLFEQRGTDARYAAGQLTCFGGRRHEGESVEDCLLRELQEELQWQPDSFNKACELWLGDRYIADFFDCALDLPVASLRCEHGRSAVVISAAYINEAALSPWHRAVLEGLAAGKDEIYLTE